MKINVKIDKDIEVDISQLLEYTLLEVINDEMDCLEVHDVDVELVKNE